MRAMLPDMVRAPRESHAQRLHFAASTRMGKAGPPIQIQAPRSRKAMAWRYPVLVPMNSVPPMATPFCGP